MVLEPTIDETRTNLAEFSPAESKEEASEVMLGYKRYMMDPSDGNAVGNRRFNKTLPSAIYSTRLRELDDTVISIGKLHRLSSQPSGEDESVCTQSIASHDSSAIYRDLIDNMQEMHLSNHFRTSLNGGAQSAIGSRSGRSSCRSHQTGRSLSTRRKKGISLESVVSKTILESADWGEAHFISTPEANSLTITSEASTEFILQDLNQAHSVIQSETGSVLCHGNSSVISSQLFERPPRNLLPPIYSQSIESDFFLSNTNSGTKSFNTLLTSDTSDETFEEREGKKTSVELTRSRDTLSPSDPFLDLGDDSFPTVNWSGESSASNSKSMNHPGPSSNPSCDGEWTSFDANPFVVTWTPHGNADDNLEQLSVESPSSITEFGAHRNSLLTKSSELEERPSFGERLSF